MHLHSFEHVHMYSMCFAFFPLQNKVQRVCKERKTKKSKTVREIDLFDCNPMTSIVF